jgi:hypothetical protein
MAAPMATSSVSGAIRVRVWVMVSADLKRDLFLWVAQSPCHDLTAIQAISSQAQAHLHGRREGEISAPMVRALSKASRRSARPPLLHWRLASSVEDKAASIWLQRCEKV